VSHAEVQIWSDPPPAQRGEGHRGERGGTGVKYHNYTKVVELNYRSFESDLKTLGRKHLE
jgi:hypothetical protein